MAKIYGNGLMWIPAWGRAVELIGGIIETDDKAVIDCAKINGFTIEGEQKECAKPEDARPRGRPAKAVTNGD